jgi:hypothetical protein
MRKDLSFSEQRHGTVLEDHVNKHRSPGISILLILHLGGDASKVNGHSYLLTSYYLSYLHRDKAT